jgi:hypothetical protein
MTFRIPALRRKPKFQRRKMADTSSPSGTHHDHDHDHGHDHDHDHHNCQHHSHAEELVPKMPLPPVPSLFTAFPPIKDTLETHSSQVQDETVQSCLPFLELTHILDPSVDLGAFGIPKLRRQHHLAYLKMMLESKYPAGFVGLDPSRPWTFYWCLNGMALLGKDVSGYGER